MVSPGQRNCQFLASQSQGSNDQTGQEAPGNCLVVWADRALSEVRTDSAQPGFKGPLPQGALQV